MSDAKAKAEARRAKILARTSNTVSAVTSNDDETDETLYNTLASAEVKVKERPLARRRQLISTNESSENLSESVTTAVGENPVKDDQKSAENATTAVSIEKKESSVPVTLDSSKELTAAPIKEESTEETKSSKIQYAPAKSLEEIEREIAEQTAKFDTSIKSESKQGAAAKKKQEATAKALALRVKPISIDPSNILRLIRVVMIVMLGAFTAFRTVEHSRSQAIMRSSIETVQASATIDIDGGFKFEDPPIEQILPTTTATTSSNTDRTWAEYFQQKLTRQMECSATAVGLVWWLSRFFSKIVHSQFKQEPKQRKPLEMVMDLLTNGISSLFETFYSGLGEVALHLFVLIVSVTLFTLYFSDSAIASGNTGNAEL